MKILITGSTGLLGQALSSHLARSCDVTGLSRHMPPGPVAGHHVVCDLLDAHGTIETVRTLRPDIVIHAQAMSDVDHCERQPQAAHAMNVEAMAHLIQALEEPQALLIHLSTDYVFDGRKGSPYDERDAPNPLSVYGRSKVEGERLALGYPRSVVVRTSTLFGAGRMNFCDHLISNLQAGKPVEAFTDQVTSPSYTDDVAEGVADLSRALWRSWDAQRPRIYHIANAGGASRVTFAERIADLLGCSQDLIRRIRMADQQHPAPRPASSALTTIHLHRVIGRTLRSWDDALQAYLRQRHPSTTLRRAS